jgi:putative aldouronate transport system permease protein
MTLQMASVVIASLPIAAVYPFIQKFYVTGITSGAVKG